MRFLNKKIAEMIMLPKASKNDKFPQNYLLSEWINTKGIYEETEDLVVLLEE